MQKVLVCFISVWFTLMPLFSLILHDVKGKKICFFIFFLALSDFEKYFCLPLWYFLLSQYNTDKIWLKLLVSWVEKSEQLFNCSIQTAKEHKYYLHSCHHSCIIGQLFLVIVSLNIPAGYFLFLFHLFFSSPFCPLCHQVAFPKLCFEKRHFCTSLAKVLTQRNIFIPI